MLESGETVCVTVSLGVACITAWEEAVDIDRLLQYADEALYVAKKSGRNRISFADGSRQIP